MPRTEQYDEPRQQRPAAPVAEYSSEVAEVQAMLAELGYDPGPADGVAGRRTREAVRQFQQDYGLGNSGAIDARLTRQLAAAQAGTLAPALSDREPPAAAKVDPSFDCARAGTPTELAICGSEELAELDRAMASALRAAREGLSGAAAEELRATQRRWLRTRDACGGDPDCIRDSMAARIAALTGPGMVPPGADPGGPHQTEPVANEFVVYSTGVQSAFREQPGHANQLGRLLTLMAAEALPGLSETDDAAVALYATAAPEAAATLFKRHSGTRSEQIGAAVKRFQETGAVGNLTQALGALSPFDRRRLMPDIRADLPARIAEAAPKGPLQLRIYCGISFGEYDFDLRAFPNPQWQNDARNCLYLALGQTQFGALQFEGRLPGFPRKLEMDESEAEAFVNALAIAAGRSAPLASTLLVSFQAEVSAPRFEAGSGGGIKFPLSAKGGYTLHPQSSPNKIVHVFPEAAPVRSDSLVEGPGGTRLLDGRTVLVTGWQDTFGVDTGDLFGEREKAVVALGRAAYLAALVGQPDAFAEDREAIQAIALFDPSEWGAIIRAETGKLPDALMSQIRFSQSRNPAEKSRDLANAVQSHLSEFDLKRLADGVRRRLPALIKAGAASRPIPVRVFCKVQFQYYDEAAGAMPFDSQQCNLSGGVDPPVQVQIEADMTGFPRQVVLPVAEAEALMAGLGAAEEGRGERSAWLSFDAVLSSAFKVPARGYREKVVTLSWSWSGPFRLHRSTDPLATVFEIPPEPEAEAPLAGEALMAAKRAGAVPWDLAREEDGRAMAALGGGPFDAGKSFGRLPGPSSGLLDLRSFDPSEPIAALGTGQRDRELAEALAVPPNRLISIANTIEPDIAGVYAVIPVGAERYSVVLPEGIEAENTVWPVPLLDIRGAKLLADSRRGAVLVLNAVPVAVMFLADNDPEPRITVALEQPTAEDVATVPFPSGAWLATDLAAKAGADAGAFLLDIAAALEPDPFKQRDLAAVLAERAKAETPPEDGRFWIGGTLTLEAYDFGSERFKAASVRLRLPPLDGTEAVLMGRSRFTFDDGALAVRLPPDEARAWAEKTGLVGHELPFRAEVRVGEISSFESHAFYAKLDVVHLDLLKPDAVMTLREGLWLNLGDGA